MSQDQLTTEDPTVVEAVARTAGEQPATAAHGELSIEEDLLVEEVSIDGMCGVY